MALETKRCYFTFGRFQPPTTGHKDNFAGVKRTASVDDYRIYISQTVDKKGNNPLPPDRKLFWMNKMFPEHKGKIHSGPRDPVKVLQDIMMRSSNHDHNYNISVLGNCLFPSVCFKRFSVSI